MTSLRAQQSATATDGRVAQSLRRLSTGLQVNTAADAAAALVISELQRSQISSLTQAISNIDRASTMARTAEAGLREISSQLVQLRTLAVKAANTGVTDSDAAAAFQSEAGNLLGSIDRVAESTKFGTLNLLDGSQGITGQVASISNPTTTVVANPVTFTFDGSENGSSTITKTVNGLTMTLSNVSRQGVNNSPSDSFEASAGSGLHLAARTSPYDFLLTFDSDVRLTSYTITNPETAGSFDLIQGATQAANNPAIANGSQPFTNTTSTFSGGTAIQWVSDDANLNNNDTYRIRSITVQKLTTVTTAAADLNADFVKAANRDIAGQSLSVNVTSAAEKAVIVTGSTAPTEVAGTTTGVEQAGALAQDEILTINGIEISLSAGLDQSGVIARINEYSSSTGVTADNPTGNVTRLQSDRFGSGATIVVSSNVAASTTSSGFGIAPLIDSGVDVVGTIGSTAAIGHGNLLTADGATVGIRSSNGLATETGDVGILHVSDHSSVFQTGIYQQETASLTLNGFSSDKLAIGTAGPDGGRNRFSSLSEMNLASYEDARHSIALIDAAIEEVTLARADVGAFEAHTLASLRSNNSSNQIDLQAADAGLRDTDYATELARFTSEQIRSETASSMLGMANQAANQILTLLNASTPLSLLLAFLLSQ